MSETISPNPQQLLSDSEVIRSAEAVSQAVDRWAVRIGIDLTPRLKGRTLLAITIMRGGLIPAAWLLQRLQLPVLLDYAHATRYRSGTTGHQLEWQHQPAIDMNRQTVLIIDDIFDEGHTLAAMSQWCLAHGASQVVTAALVRKQHARGLARDWLDYPGLDVPDEYVFGCGMDIYEHWRHLPEIRAYRPATRPA